MTAAGQQKIGEKTSHTTFTGQMYMGKNLLKSRKVTGPN